MDRYGQRDRIAAGIRNTIFELGALYGRVNMTAYVVTTRWEARTSSSTAEQQVREVPGVRIRSSSNPHCITVEASEFAAAEIQRRFGSVLLVEPEISARLDKSN
ncbi:hypothetical protein [Microvirga arsenatis]|uniref:Uncharacterized protein n=1 Tax=Microvirga arsenatis TaxID=2692265 RepID=A0ABW9Z9E1_9HYPH|nr:hypothetical protein [Microvirga arsenatis]NBJ13817.1 hypothetical protein [Microvirga arsenatis]NBJ27259.1 hypothetical protein [Microvirga arsenatis]